MDVTNPVKDNTLKLEMGYDHKKAVLEGIQAGCYQPSGGAGLFTGRGSARLGD
jgi:hypothetical protein